MNKMIIHDPPRKTTKMLEHFGWSSFEVHRHSSTIVVHHYDTYNKNKIKMAGVRFLSAFSNDDPEAPMEVYSRKLREL